MILRARIRNLRITLTMAHVVDVTGVNSCLPDGRHILMWDFDNTKLDTVMQRLKVVQSMFGLSSIFIFRSSAPDNYIAYCLQAHSWEATRAIIAWTKGIDGNFYKWGIFRKRFTLRVGKKCGSTPKIAAMLVSPIKGDVQVQELQSWVSYETLDSHHSQVIVEKAVM